MFAIMQEERAVKMQPEKRVMHVMRLTGAGGNRHVAARLTDFDVQHACGTGNNTVLARDGYICAEIARL